MRVGLALVAWGRRADARRLPESVAQRRDRQLVADELLAQGFSTVALLTRPSL